MKLKNILGKLYSHRVKSLESKPRVDSERWSCKLIYEWFKCLGLRFELVSLIWNTKDSI